MTVPNTAIFNNYAGNDSTTVFPYVFKIFEDADLEVVIADANDTQYILVLNTDYTVTDAGEEAGGTVVYTGGGTPLPTGWIISIALNLDMIQEVDLRNQGPYFAETHEDEFDYLTKLIQQLAESITRCLKVSITSGVDPSADALTDALNAAVVAAEAAETGAEAAQVAAEAAQVAAEAAQTGAEAAETAITGILPLPGGVGNATKRLKVNAAGDAYEQTDTQAATGAQIDAAVAASHAQSHTAASHSDQASTGAAVDAAVAAGKAALGSWASRTPGTIYQAATDGFVVGRISSGSGTIYVKTDAASTPTTIRIQEQSGSGASYAGVMCPVKKNDYYQLFTTATAIGYWIPLS